MGFFNKDLIQCPNCHYEGKAKYWHNQKDIFILDLFLIVFFFVFICTVIVPIGIAIFFLATSNKKICPKCGYKYVVKK